MFFSRTMRSISTKLGTKHHWVRGFKFVQMKDPVRFQGQIITKYQKYIDEILKSDSEKPLCKFQTNLSQSILEYRDSVLLQGEIITKKLKYIDEI